MCVAAHPTAPTEVVLDLDATDDPIHGKQEGRFFHGFYGGDCCLPLYIFSGEHRLGARLRTTNRDVSDGALAEVARIVAHLRAVWPDVRIILRADSGFCRDALLAWCEAQGVDYVIGLGKNARLRTLIANDLAAVAAERTATEAPVRRFVALTYQTLARWSCSRCVVARAEHLPAESIPRFVVTSLAPARWAAVALYEDLSCAHGDMENRIKEQPLMLFAGPTTAATLRANQLRLHGASVAYLRLFALRRLALAGTTLARAHCQPLRLTLLKVGARVRVTMRKVWLALASGSPHAARQLTKLGARDLVLVNRSLGRAGQLARAVRGRAAPMEARHGELAMADAAVIATSSSPIFCTAPLAAARSDSHTEREPLLPVDLSLPRNVAPSAAELPSVVIVDLDALRPALAAAERERISSVPGAEAIVQEELADFLTWLAAASAREAIRPLRKVLERICVREVSFASGDEVAQRTAERIVAKVLARPMMELRSALLRGAPLDTLTGSLVRLFEQGAAAEPHPATNAAH